jgi:heat shock protein HslJ
MEHIRKPEKIPFFPALAGVLILISLLVAAGCTGHPPAPAPSGPVLNGTDWTLASYRYNGSTISVLNGSVVTLGFSGDGRITGTAGCNHYFAAYDLQGTTITVGEAGSTLMYCMAPGVMDQESAYLTLLREARTVTAGNTTLTLEDASGTPILSFTRTVPPVPASLAGTLWTLESFHTADAVSSVIAGTTITAIFGEDGTITGSAGCNRYFASWNVSGTGLTIGPAGSTKMYCGDPGVMEQEMAYLAALKRAAGYTLDGDRLSIRDAGGKTILSYAKEA